MGIGQKMWILYTVFKNDQFLKVSLFTQTLPKNQFVVGTERMYKVLETAHKLYHTFVHS